MRRFIDVNRAGLRGDDYGALYDWSVASPAEFWEAVWQFCEIKAAAPYDGVLRDAARMPGAKWFEGAKLNFAANLLGHDARGTAIVFANERNERSQLTWPELRAQVASVAARLRALGVRRGDRIAAFIANRPEAVVAMLATASIGAVWSSCSPDFGVDSVPTLRAVAARLPDLTAVVVVPYRSPDPELSSLPNAHLFDELLEQDAEPSYEAVPFDAPLYILYSS